MTPEFYLAMAGFITIFNLGILTFVLLICSTIVYSWYRSLTIEKDKLPQLIQAAVNEISAQYAEVLAEISDGDGRLYAEPVKAPDLVLEDE